MSEMEFKFGYFKVSDKDIEPDEDDGFYNLEEEHGCHFVEVDGVLYEAHLIGDHDPYGFSFYASTFPYPYFVAYWYNGGGSIHEVLESIIREWVKNGRE